VAVARDRLSAQLRQAVLGSRRPELLLRYSTLPEAADDAVVWRALVQWLPSGAPRRAAHAQLQRLEGGGNAPWPGRLAPTTWRP
jgi:hypothetical protein